MNGKSNRPPSRADQLYTSSTAQRLVHLVSGCRSTVLSGHIDGASGLTVTFGKNGNIVCLSRIKK